MMRLSERSLCETHSNTDPDITGQLIRDLHSPQTRLGNASFGANQEPQATREPPTQRFHVTRSASINLNARLSLRCWGGSRIVLRKDIAPRPSHKANPSSDHPLRETNPRRFSSRITKNHDEYSCMSPI